ncbi:MAG TPA: sensor domain-containing diguanylate cyclase [Candidatus Eisenbacteria bacterium]|jgi:diguanylate cyclase (GGDEF)-like protein
MSQPPISLRDLLGRVLPLEDLPLAHRSWVERDLRGGLANRLQSAGRLLLERLEGRPASVPRPQGPGEPMPAQLEVLEPPGTESDEVLVFARASLPSRAPAALDQVRRLLRLEDAALSSDPRSAVAYSALRDPLDLAGREWLGATITRLFPIGSADEPMERPPIDSALAAEAMSRPRSIYYCPDLTKSPRLAAAASRWGVRSLVAAAVAATDGRLLGHLEVASDRVAPFDAEDLARIALLAEWCGAALERAARLENLMFVDELTGIYTRRYYELQIRNEIARAQRDRASMALCIADIDDFKSFNTAFGYQGGNQVLVQVAQVLKGGVRPFDAVARWGGEEFTVLLTSPVEAEDVAAISERLRVAVERMNLRIEGLDRRTHQPAVTVSIGVAMFPQHAGNPESLWAAANQALLAAKRPPKNRVMFYRE